MTLLNRDRMQDKDLSSKLLILTVNIGMSKGMKQIYFLQAIFMTPKTIVFLSHMVHS